MTESPGIDRRSAGWHPLPLLALVALLLVAVALVARAGPYTEPPPEPGASTATATSDPSQPTLSPQPTNEFPARVPSDVRGLASLTGLQVLADVIVIIVVLLTIYSALVALGAIPRPRFRRRGSTARGAAGTAPIPRPGAELADAVDHALDLVEHGEARDAVVACWLLMIQAAGESGSPMRASETSREYADRLAAEQLVSPGPLARLGELYREARFSQHMVGSDLRAEARRALGVLQTELRSGVRL